MSTTLGIITDEGLPGVVIAADSQENKEEEGNVTTKRRYFKIGFGQNCWAMAWSGTWCKSLSDFYRYLRKDEEKAKEKIKRAIETGEFEDILRLNQKVCRLDDIDHTNAFILGTNFPNIGLYYIDEYGNIKNIEGEDDSFFVLGSGEDEARAVLEDKLSEEEVGSHRITLEHAIITSARAIEMAKKDIRTGGYADLVVIEENRIYPYRKEILKALNDAYWQKIDTIARRHVRLKEPKTP